jgi:hypothetical protein
VSNAFLSTDNLHTVIATALISEFFVIVLQPKLRNHKIKHPFIFLSLLNVTECERYVPLAKIAEKSRTKAVRWKLKRKL